MNNLWNSINDEIYNINTKNVYGKMIEQIERIVIMKVLEQVEGNQILAAKILGLHRNTLHNKIKKFNINIRSFKK
jgi:two-component system nitrogen regulation response regulator GlnG